MDLKELIKSKQNQVSYVYLSGELDGKFFHVIFVPCEGKFKPFVLFEHGRSIEIQEDKHRSYFEYKGKRYYFLNGDKLGLVPGIVNHPSPRAFEMVINHECPDPDNLYRDLLTMLNDYYDFYSEEERRIVASYIIHTYLLNLIGYTIYLMLEGEFNTGKSSLQITMSLLQYNGFFSGQITMPTLVRKIHNYQGTANIDEFDKLSPEARQNTIGILNSGAYQGGTYEITDMNKKTTAEQIKVIQAFSAKTFSANKIRLDSSLESRCIVIRTVRGSRRTKPAQAIPESEKLRFQAIRDKLFAYCLMKGRQILKQKEAVREELAAQGFNARRADIVSVLVGIERDFGQDDQVLNYLKDSEEFEQEDSQDEDREFHMYNFLLGKCREVSADTTNLQFTNKELLDHINHKLGYDEFDLGLDEKYKATAVSVGKMLKRHKIVCKKSDRERITSGTGRGRYRYTLKKDRIIDLLKRSRYKEIQEKARELSTCLMPLPKTKDTPLPF